MNRKKTAGFTLIEIMIVAAIIGILLAVATPSYQQYVIETRRSDAHVALTSAATQQERFYTYNSAYTMDTDDLGGSTSPEGFYTISVSTPEGAPPPASPQQFTLRAEPASGSPLTEDFDCQAMTVNHLGVRESFDGDGNTSSDCW